MSPQGRSFDVTIRQSSTLLEYESEQPRVLLVGFDHHCVHDLFELDH